MKQTFEKLCDWLDNQAKLFTIKELHEKLCSISKNGEDIYSLKRMKQKLGDHYGETTFLTNLPGRSNTVSVKDTGCEIINDKWYKDRKENLYEEKSRMISAAAKLIKNEVCCTKLNTNFYPTLEDIGVGIDFLPPSLRLLMELLIGSSSKQASLGQNLLKAMKPNTVIQHLLFGLRVEIDLAIGSKNLLTELSKLDYSISYDEIKRYKQSLVKNESNSIASAVTEFTQFVADNVDHNDCTLDGKGIFHGMGIITCSINR